jgi:hypothetical protein
MTSMGFLSSETKEEKLERLDREAEQRRSGPRWEYRARNMKKVIGPGMEGDFNKAGEEGWEFVAMAEGYAIFQASALKTISSTGPGGEPNA